MGGARCSLSPDSGSLHSGDQDLQLAKTQHLGFRTTQLLSVFFMGGEFLFYRARLYNLSSTKMPLGQLRNIHILVHCRHLWGTDVFFPLQLPFLMGLHRAGPSTHQDFSSLAPPPRPLLLARLGVQGLRFAAPWPPTSCPLDVLVFPQPPGSDCLCAAILGVASRRCFARVISHAEAPASFRSAKDFRVVSQRRGFPRGLAAQRFPVSARGAGAPASARGAEAPALSRGVEAPTSSRVQRLPRRLAMLRLLRRLFRRASEIDPSCT